MKHSGKTKASNGGSGTEDQAQTLDFAAGRSSSIMALRSLSRAFPAGLLRRASGPLMGPVRDLSPASGGRLMGTRCQEKETQEMIAAMQKTAKETQAAATDGHLLLRRKFNDFQEKTTRDLDELTKFAKIMSKAATVSLGVAIVGVPLLLITGSNDHA